MHSGGTMDISVAGVTGFLSLPAPYFRRRQFSAFPPGEIVLSRPYQFMEVHVWQKLLKSQWFWSIWTL